MGHQAVVRGVLFHRAVGRIKNKTMREGMMKAKALAICLLYFSVLGAVWAQSELELNENPPETYTVKKGDTLWDISGMYLEKPWRWPELWDVNPQIDNPHLIYPGDVLYLVYVDGQPRLRVRRGEGGRTVKLTPNMRIEPLDLAIPVIPLDEINPFLKGHRVMSAEELENSAYIVAGAQKHLISAQGDRIFGRGYFEDGERAYGIYRKSEVYYDPITQELLGYQAQDIGNAQLLSSNLDEIVELEVTRVTEEVRITDRLLPMEERVIAATFQPRAPEVEIKNGFMIAVDGGVNQVGPWDIVVINRGKREGLEVGHVLAIYQAGERVYDQVRGDEVTLPDVRAGLLMIFETFDKVSYGVVLKTNRPLAVMDKVRNP